MPARTAPRTPARRQRPARCGRTPWQDSVRAAGFLQPELLAEDLAHDLVGTAADRSEARVTRRSLDLVLLHVAGAAEDLERRVGHVERVPLGLQLRDRD